MRVNWGGSNAFGDAGWAFDLADAIKNGYSLKNSFKWL